MLKLFVKLMLLAAILVMACMGIALIDEHTPWISQMSHQFPTLKKPLNTWVATGENLLSRMDDIRDMGHSAWVSTSVRITGETAESLKSDIGKTFFPDADTRARRKIAKEQLQTIRHDLDAKTARVEQLQEQIAQLQKQRKSLELTINPLSKYAPDFSGGINMLHWGNDHPEDSDREAHHLHLPRD